MWKSGLFVALVCSVLLVTAASRGDVAPQSSSPPPGIATSEPATTPLGPNPPRDPFTLYDQGPPGAAVEYDDLHPEDQAFVNRGQDASNWRAVHDSYDAAITQRANAALATFAQRRLGVDNLGDIGVVP